jgi:hypothetical protein
MAQPAFPEAAYTKLVNEVYRPVFLEKLARDWGIVPRDEAEAQQLLDMAGELRSIENEETVKTGGSPVINEAGDFLKIAAQQRGHPQQPSSMDRMIQKVAADAVAADPDLATAALQFGEFLVQAQ